MDIYLVVVVGCWERGGTSAAKNTNNNKEQEDVFFFVWKEWNEASKTHSAAPDNHNFSFSHFYSFKHFLFYRVAVVVVHFGWKIKR